MLKLQTFIAEYVLILRMIPLFMLFGTALSYFLPYKIIEKYIVSIVRFCTLGYLMTSFLLLISFLLSNPKEAFLFGSLELHDLLTCRYFLDWFSCAFLFLSSIIAFITLFFAGRMLHREPGFARFFIGSSILIFGMTLILTSRDFDILFAGWELLGMSSFLMIGFYRNRIVAAKHATRAMAYFRISDLGLLVGVFMVHAFGEGFEDFAFLKQNLTLELLTKDHFFWLSLFLLLSATGKSAQFPFSHWLPRAMEGPSNSSSIFYGAISIHMGIFLLLRTSNLWQDNSYFRIALFIIGAFSLTHAFLISFFQTNIKSKIAWNSIGHLGLMFVELSLNLQTICMVHAMFNAISKSIQYLTASSALILEARVVHLHKQRLFEVSSPIARFFKAAQNEFYFDFWFKYLIVRPYFRASKTVSNPYESQKQTKLELSFTIISLFISFLIVAFGFWIEPSSPFFQTTFSKNLPVAAAALVAGLCFVIVSILELRNPVYFYSNSHMAVFLISLSILFIGEPRAFEAFLSFNFGVNFGYLLIQLCIIRVFYLCSIKKDPSNGYYGLAETLPWISSILFLGSMITICMPITSAFFGEDFLLELGHRQFELPVFIAGAGVFVIQIASIMAISKLYFGYTNKSISFVKDLPSKIAIPLFALSMIVCMYSLWKFKFLIH